MEVFVFIKAAREEVDFRPHACTMQNTPSSCIHVFLLITVGLVQCLALKQISVMQGDTLTLTCRHKNTKKSDALEWKNPDGLLLFFNEHKVFKDNRTKFVSLTDSEFTIHVTNITFEDGGIYRCLRYNNQVSTKRYKVFVVGAPKLEKDEQEDKTIVKCSATANEHPPSLSWLMDNGLEIDAHPYYEVDNTSKKYTAVSQLNMKVPKKRVTVRCLVRHSALHSFHLENFIHIGRWSRTSSKHSSTTLRPTDTTVIPRTLFTTTSFTNSPSESETTNDSNTSVNGATDSTSSNGSANILSNTTANEITESISETTVGTISDTSIESPSNTTGNDSSHVDTHRSKMGHSVLLVLLVTCLLICLFVVLAFFLVRLRKAHIAWKKENEESDQSVESSKSKSSSEERQKQQQRVQGFWNTSFTKYKAEETVENEAKATPASAQVINENPQHFISRSAIKETEL